MVVFGLNRLGPQRVKGEEGQEARSYRLQIKAVKVLEALKIPDSGNPLPVQADSLQFSQSVKPGRTVSRYCNGMPLLYCLSREDGRGRKGVSR